MALLDAYANSGLKQIQCRDLKPEFPRVCKVPFLWLMWWEEPEEGQDMTHTHKHMSYTLVLYRFDKAAWMVPQ